MGERKYRCIETRIWKDEKVRGLSPYGKLVLIFVMTHEQTTGLGIMNGSVNGLADSFPNSSPNGSVNSSLNSLPNSLSNGQFRKAFEEVKRTGLIEVDEANAVIAFPTFMKHSMNHPRNPNTVKSWVRIVETLPECEFVNRHLSRVRDQLADAWSVKRGKEKVRADRMIKCFCNCFINCLGNGSAYSSANSSPYSEQCTVNSEQREVQQQQGDLGTFAREDRSTVGEGESAAAVDDSYPKKINLLTQAGFDLSAADKIAASARVETIQQQIGWIDQRGITNRLGALRRAIEQDWGPPDLEGSNGRAAPSTKPEHGVDLESMDVAEVEAKNLDLWTAIMRSEIDRDDIEAWFTGLRIAGWDQSTVVLGSPGVYCRDWVERHWSKWIRSVLEDVVFERRIKKLVFVVSDEDRMEVS